MVIDIVNLMGIIVGFLFSLVNSDIILVKMVNVNEY